MFMMSWVVDSWEPSLGYILVIHSLVWGWVGFFFRYMEHAQQSSHQRWFIEEHNFVANCGFFCLTLGKK